MEWHNILQAVLSLMFVLGLLFLTLWLVKYCELKGLKCRFVKKLKDAQRLNISEIRRIDSKNTLMLLQCDDCEYLILQSPSSNLVLDKKTRNLESTNPND